MDLQKQLVTVKKNLGEIQETMVSSSAFPPYAGNI